MVRFNVQPVVGEPVSSRRSRELVTRWFVRSGVLVAWSLMLTALVGCGGDSGPARYDVSGTVTYKGQPVPQGVIQFLPDASKGNPGPAVNANIVEGKYDTAVSGKGSIGGAHTVVINGFDGNARPADELPLGAPLFPEYRSTAELPKSVGETVDFEVQP